MSLNESFDSKTSRRSEDAKVNDDQDKSVASDGQTPRTFQPKILINKTSQMLMKQLSAGS